MLPPERDSRAELGSGDLALSANMNKDARGMPTLTREDATLIAAGIAAAASLAKLANARGRQAVL
jgi:hypothetical protein